MFITEQNDSYLKFLVLLAVKEKETFLQFLSNEACVLFNLLKILY